MEPLDLSSLVLLSDGVKKPAAKPSDLNMHIGNVGQKRSQNLSTPSSSRGRSFRDIANLRPRFACPFHKHDPNRFNSTDYERCVGKSFKDMSTLTEHIWWQHTDLYRCPVCNQRSHPQFGLEFHRRGKKLCELDPQPRLPQDITPATLAALRKMRESRKPQMPETEWQNIYQLLFPDDDRTFSPYVESAGDQSEHDSESTISYGPRRSAPWTTTEDLEVRRKLRLDDERRRWVQAVLDAKRCRRQEDLEAERGRRDLIKKIKQDQQNKDGMERVDRDLKKEMEQTQRDEEYMEHVEEDTRESGMTHASPYHIPTNLTDLHEQEAKSLECGRHESQNLRPQSTVTKDTIIRTQHGFLMDRYLEDHAPPPTRDDSPSRREPQSPTISSPLAGDDFDAELSPLDSRESPSGTSEQGTELSEEEELQSSDFDDTDTSSRTYLSFDPVKRALFDKQSRQFWSVYNGLSVSDWFALWTKHTVRKRAISENEKIPRATHTSSDTRTSSECPSNSPSSIAPKRRKRDDEDETNDNRNPSKRSNRTLPQKEGLNLACPFHKYKPWKYNHGILRFRTCSTTPFDAIFRLKEHLRRVHPPPLHCTRCWQTFADQNSLINHGQADIPCQRRQPVPVEGWTAEMGKNVSKRKDETERERWERIYRELFGRTLTDVPSPYFVPYDLSAANDTDLETLLHQEVPQILLNWLRERVNNMEPYVAQQFLSSISDSSDSSDSYRGFDTMIGRAIDEAFTTYRSTAATANNPEAPLTPQSSSANPSIAGDNRTAQSVSYESTRIVPLLSSRDQSGSSESLQAVMPLKSPEPTQQQNNYTQPSGIRNPFRGFHEQSRPPAAEVVPHASETVSNSFLPDPASQLQSAEEYMQQQGHHDVTSAYDANMDEYVFVNFDLEGGFDEEAFSNVPSGSDGPPACS